MKRGTPFLAAVMIIAAAFGMFPAHADPPLRALEYSPHAGCNPVRNGTIFGHGYLYCGYHWAHLPARFAVVADSAPASLQQQFRGVVRSAAAEWNKWWPRQGASCGPLLCDRTGDATVTNTIRFGALPDGVLGRTTVTSEGTTITGAEIVLSSSVRWHVANGADLASGEQAGLAAAACAGPTCNDWYDLQDVVAHELGHVVGLEDLGNEGDCLGDLGESADLSQTMYGCFWGGDTSKRSLSWGDIAGLDRIADDY